MTVTLGLNELWYDASAALVRGGEVLAAVEEERLSGTKHGPGFAAGGDGPIRAIEWCLRARGLRDRDIARVAVSVDMPARRWAAYCWANLANNLRRMSPGNLWRQRVQAGDPSMNVLGYTYGYLARRRRFLAELRRRFREVRVVEHHRAHAASVWRLSGMPEAAVVVMDGMGERFSTTTWRASGGRLQGPLLALGKEGSLGTLYTTVTGLVGLGPFGEGKTMGLAPYGAPRPGWRSIVTVGGGRYAIDWRRLRDLGVFARRADEEIAPIHQDLAATVQQRLEAAAAEVLAGLHEETGLRRFCLAGGVAMNCTMVAALERLPFVDALFVSPFSMDMGAAVGAALEAEEAEPGERIATARWGPAFREEEILAALAEAGLRAERALDPADRAAELLAAGAVIGWFQGALEFGPRALGGRSILADPRDAATRDRVNRLKGREAWRPLAPAVSAERYADWFEGAPDPFMTRACAVRPEARPKIPAVVHVDGSARVQAADAAHEPELHRLLRAFERRTGAPVLLNTSLNVAGAPLAATPRDAIETFRAAGLDALFIGDCVVRRGPE